MKSKLSVFLIGFGAGAITVAMLPTLKPLLTDVARPLTKALLKHGMLGLERWRTAVALVTESLDDLMAEVRAEVDAELTGRRSTNGSSRDSAGPETSSPSIKESGAKSSLS